MNIITSLAPNQVFVFGANQTGFHGAGAAGQACRGTPANTWRTDPWFLKAMRSPVGSPDRIGLWAVYGVARGWQRGREGMSYAIETIQRPGFRRSTPLPEIEAQIVELIQFAREHPEWQFLMTPIGAGLSGYTATEMTATLARALVGSPAPVNLVIPDDLYGSVSWQST